MTKRGFTLVELLIVIAILAVLAGILFTVFAPAKEKARQTHCMNNLKQLGAAILLYKADYDGGWPESVIKLWPNYVSSKELYVCPDDGTSKADREKLEKVFNLPYCTYGLCGGDHLGAISGELLRRALASSIRDCDRIATAMLATEYASRFPVVMCYCHLMPGSDFNRHEWHQLLQDNDVHSVIPTLNQDGSVQFITTPGRWGRAIVPALHNHLGLTSGQWLALRDEYIQKAVDQGLCDKDEGEEEE